MSTITLVQTSLLHLHYAHTIDSPTRHIYPEEKGRKKKIYVQFFLDGEIQTCKIKHNYILACHFYVHFFIQTVAINMYRELFNRQITEFSYSPDLFWPKAYQIWKIS